MSLDAAHLLWEDRDAFRAPWRTATRNLEALGQDLEDEASLDGRACDFLRARARIAEADPDLREGVWEGPLGYAWTLRARRLLEAFRSPEPRGGDPSGPRQCLVAHFDRFQAFPLGLAIRGGRDLMLDRPVAVASPFAIPGTRLSIETLGTAGTFTLHGVAKGRLRVEEQGGVVQEFSIAHALDAGRIQTGGLALNACPVARHAGFELPLHPHAFAIPDLAMAEPVVRAGLAYQRRQVPLVEATLANLHRFAPSAFATFRNVIQLAGLKPRDWGGYDDYSHADLPGSLWASTLPHPLELGDHFVHELQHNRLQMIEERGPFFEGRSGEEPRCYSPWRDELRGLYGIFHGVFVWLGVHRYWRGAFERLDADRIGEPERAYVVDRLLRIPAQLDLALAVLDRFARLTPLGRALLDQYHRDVAAIHAERHPDLPADAPAFMITPDGACIPQGARGSGGHLTVSGALREHLSRHDLAGQCAGLLADLPT